LTDTRLRPPNDPVLERQFGKGVRPRFAFALLRFLGWRVVLSQPVPRRCVVVFYPNTSNWDFPVGLLGKWATGIDFRWIGKHTLFETPLGRWFARWGGIPVDRGDAAGFVDQVAAMFASHDDFALVITPEGTRRRTEHWKSGFYRLALAARVPVGLAFIDRATRRVGIGAWLDLQGDAAVDLAAIRAFYADKRAWNPAQAGSIRFRDRPPG
jgi:1-acyl-sn-glycerol-3-phosphate acyltransferase